MQAPGACTTPVQLVLVTRPARQAEEWVSKLRAQGVPAQALPLIGIAAAPDVPAVRAAWAAFQTTAAQPGCRPQLMFVSPNAASCFFAALAAPEAPQAEGLNWPATARALATGPGTVAALRAAGVPRAAILAPDEAAQQFDSEALWARMAQEAWAQQPVWIARGDGGRDWLAQTLSAAGAPVSFVQAYARSAPQWGLPQRAVLAQALAQPHSTRWLISSSEALAHLPGLLAEHAPQQTVDWALATALASHPRIASSCERFGFGRVQSLRPTLQAVLDALAA